MFVIVNWLLFALIELKRNIHSFIPQYSKIGYFYLILDFSSDEY